MYVSPEVSLSSSMTNKENLTVNSALNLPINEIQNKY